jgi:hypothetical protein
MQDVVIVMRWNVALGLSDHLFGGVSNAVQGVVGNLNSIAASTLVMKVCPDSAESTLFSWVMGITWVGSAVSSVFGSMLTEALGITAIDFSSLDTLVWWGVLFSAASAATTVLVPSDAKIERASSRMSRELGEAAVGQLQQSDRPVGSPRPAHCWGTYSIVVIGIGAALLALSAALSSIALVVTAAILLVTGLALPVAISFVFQWGSRAVRYLPAHTALNKNYEYDGEVLIVGAGAAGLAAAKVLEKSQIRYSILEATDRYGGRLKADTGFADVHLDLGAE